MQGRQIVESNAESTPKVFLIQSDEAEPRVRLVPGERFEVAVAAIVDNDLQKIEAESKWISRYKKPARLCGSTSTCIAKIVVGPECEPEDE
jgi:hypothetical protein